MKKCLVLLFVVISLLFLFYVFFSSPLSTQECPPGALATSKGNSLYLYFPTASDSTFPDYSSYGAHTSPADPFNVSDLDSGIGTTAQLRQRIFEMVRDDYCEFNVGVIMTTTAPSPTEANWQIVAIGSDSDTITGGITIFGEAQAVDINDSDHQDYARVWAGSFGVAYGGTGGTLAGTKSTLERWATAIGETTAHEAAHNYGPGHSDANPRTGSGEDAVTNHILATGSSGLTGEIRASVNRHFSDTSYELLGHNLGLNTKTLHNWDFTNPNNLDAHSVRLKLLSAASSLTISWSYNGTLSPWTSPTVTSTGSTEKFQESTYNVFQLEFTTGKAWSGGANGVAPPGVRFHIGASFSEPEAVIVRGTKLLDSGSSELPLSPRLFGYDTGAADLSTGDFALTFFNPDPERPLILRELVVRRVPRMVDINSMVEDARPIGLQDMPINIISSCREFKQIEIRDQEQIRLAKLTDTRNVDITYDPKDCIKRHILPQGPGDVAVGELEYCPEGTALSLFPSTYVYVTATVVDPNARYWDAEQGQFVNGPLESKIFYQFAGIVPDFNNNGVDDLLDIRNGTSEDENNNGVPDETEQPERPDILKKILYLIILLLVILLIVLLIMLYRTKKRKEA